ncbi:MAG: hypothetical protein IIA89_07200 [Chloroflexi bacterium]|nr:hypothetical protein [Chloroflexota bacterium]
MDYDIVSIMIPKEMLGFRPKISSWFRSADVRQIGLLAAVFFLLTLAFTWPLLKEMGRAVVGQYGDNLYFIWLIGWTEKAIFELHQSPLVSYLLNYPEGWRLASSESTPLMVLTGLPFSMLGGATFGYNASIVISFVLSGVFTGYWVARLTGSTWSGIVSGVIFAFAPFRMSHFLVGHLNILGTHWLVLYFLAMFEVLASTGRARLWMAIAVISLGLIALTSNYYLYMTLILSVPYVVAGAALLRPPETPYGKSLFRASAVLLLAAPIVLIAVAPYLIAAVEGYLPVRPLGLSGMYSASPTDYLLPFTGHPLWGDSVGYRFDRSLWPEATLYLGVVSSLLALVAIVKRKIIPLGSNKTAFFVVIVIAAFILSMGSQLRWLSQPVNVELPQALSFLRSDDGSSLAMPALLLYRYLPFYASMRVAMRYAVYVILFVSLLAGSAVAWLLSKSRPGLRVPIAIAVMGLVILDFLPPAWSFTEVKGRAVDDWLATQPNTGAVAQFPLHIARDQKQLYYTLVHGKPIIVPHADFDTLQFVRVESSLKEFPAAESIETLRELGVRYILVDGNWYSERHLLDDIQLALADQGVNLINSVDEQYVYILE